MAKGKARAGAGRSRRPAEEDSFLVRVGTEFAGLLLLGSALLGCLALASYSPSDPVFQLAAPVDNRAGVVGATLAGGLFAAVGYAAFVVVVAAAWLGGRLVLARGLPAPGSRFWLGTALLVVSVSSLPGILHELAPGRLGSPEGGVLGSFLVAHEQLLFSSWGALLISVLLLALGVLYVSGVSIGTLVTAVGTGARVFGDQVLRAARAAWRGLGRAGALLAGLSASLSAGARRTVALFVVWRERRARRVRMGADAEGTDEGDGRERAEPEAERSIAAGEAESAAALPRKGRRAAEPDIVDHVAERQAAKEPSQGVFEFPEGASSDPFCLPDISIFHSPLEDPRTYDRDSLIMNSRILEKKLLDFAIRGRVVRVHPGPVVTMYEYEPASGIKVNRIVSLADDLAMALRAISVRIIAPLPGKSVVGIEIPNTERETVYLRSVLEDDGFRKADSLLTVAMGKDIFGSCVSADLARMPHLLVAGATGTGKSVFLNSFLCSLLCRATPDELKLLLVDPKLLELSVYEGIPHLIADVVTNPKRAAAALQGIVLKMEERYQMMSAVQVRNVDQFNAKVDREIENGNHTFRLRPRSGEEEGEEVEYRRLPYIVVVIDELADLMVLVAKDVEESLQRLAQMARAAGIHLVLATQRPSVDVLTGVIKANFPARVSFQVSSGIDSRTVLDQRGAENLLGMGDMLFLPPGTSVLQRLHGCFVSEKEVTELVAYLRDQGKPEFDESLVRIARESATQESADEDVDEMFDRAVAIVAETRNASISYIQRRLKIGYNRAARIIEKMETDGMVGPQEGTKGRAVFLRQTDEEDYE